MLIFRKNGRIFEILALPGESVSKGEYLIISEDDHDYKILIQVIDIDYVDIPGLLEELLREGMLNNGDIKHFSPIDLSRTIRILRDTKLLTCIARGAVINGKFTTVISDLPSRVNSKIHKIPTSDVISMINVNNGLKVEVGLDENGERVCLDASVLDGSLTLITGMKGVGKSHLAKLLVLQLIKHGAPVIVFDLNGEYLGLTEDRNIELLLPGKNLLFSSEYLGRETFLSVLVHVLELPGVSANMFNELWSIFERRGYLSIDNMIEITNRIVNNMMIRDAIISRLMILKAMRFVSDNECTPLESLVERGKGLIIQLRGLSSIEKKVLVEIILSKLVNLLENNSIPPLFLFAEEAHIYIRDTYWEDIITRMRHYGLYVVFITNQPDSIDNKVFRQIDNIFIFRFLNEYDLELLSKVSNIDAQTIKSLAKELSIGQCIIIGKLVNDIPIIVKVLELPVKAFGESKKVFTLPVNVDDGRRHRSFQ